MDLFEYSVVQALQTLQKGGIILYPTDTVWGIGCDATNPAAIQRIYQLKRRSESKSMIILVADERAILQYTAQPPPTLHDFLEQTDRPTTVIYDNALELPDALVHPDGSIAIRIVRERFCKTLIHRLKKPLVSTSANISGTPSPSVFSQISKEIFKGVDYVVDYRRDEDVPATPSRIIRIHADGSLQIIRE
jgi:L-threonylcarbamoyladenylate synthase